eukprot:TRINITY_DN66631_c0_g1_i2.p2 TRINITY_DN66631_c0_g1~~TRINITY_DN66631_c0_g1_i2.p2  ORF type:complete len:147 (+),score=56.42 TRINITY_DN66631_c0_g1_i2:175-615(+)
MGLMKDNSMLFEKENPALMEEEKEPVGKNEDDLLIQDITPGDSLYLDVAEDLEEPNENIIISPNVVEPQVQVTGKEKEFNVKGNINHGDQEKKQELDFIKKGIYHPEAESHGGLKSVSYTHLTLPTILLVQISVVAVSLKKKKTYK